MSMAEETWRKVTFAAKWSTEDLDQIKARAEAWAKETGQPRANVSEYVRRCALGLLEASESSIAERFDRLERRLQLLEDRAEASAW